MDITDLPDWRERVRAKYNDAKLAEWEKWADDWVRRRDMSIIRAIDDGRITSIEHAKSIVCNMWLDGECVHENDLFIRTADLFPGKDIFDG